MLLRLVHMRVLNFGSKDNWVDKLDTHTQVLSSNLLIFTRPINSLELITSLIMSSKITQFYPCDRVGHPYLSPDCILLTSISWELIEPISNKSHWSMSDDVSKIWIKRFLLVNVNNLFAKLWCVFSQWESFDFLLQALLLFRCSPIVWELRCFIKAIHKDLFTTHYFIPWKDVIVFLWLNSLSKAGKLRKVLHVKFIPLKKLFQLPLKSCIVFNFRELRIQDGVLRKIDPQGGCRTSFLLQKWIEEVIDLWHHLNVIKVVTIISIPKERAMKPSKKGLMVKGQVLRKRQGPATMSQAPRKKVTIGTKRDQENMSTSPIIGKTNIVAGKGNLGQGQVVRESTIGGEREMNERDRNLWWISNFCWMLMLYEILQFIHCKICKEEVVVYKVFSFPVRHSHKKPSLNQHPTSKGCHVYFFICVLSLN